MWLFVQSLASVHSGVCECDEGLSQYVKNVFVGLFVTMHAARMSSTDSAWKCA